MIGLPLADVQADPEIGPDLLSDAASELSQMDTFVSNWARNTALDDLEARGGTKLSPQELNEKYKNVETPFTTPMSELSAYHLNEEGLKRKNLKEAINNSPSSDFYKGAVNFKESFIAHALDPVEFGAGALSGWAFRGAGFLMSKAAAPTVAKVGEVLSRQGFVYDAAEGIVGNAVLEPYMMNSAERAQTDYTLTDAITNTVAGGIAFPVLKFAGAKSIDLVKKLPSSSVNLAIKNGLGQIFSGKKPDVSLITETFDELAYKSNPDVKMGPVRTNYEYIPKTADELRVQPMFIASKQAGTLDGGSKPVGDLRFGEDGLYITDNPKAANNIAAHPLDTDGPPGDVFSANINDVNLLDLDLAGREVLDVLDLPDDIKAMIKDADTVHDAYEIIAGNVTEGMDPQAMKAFTEAIRGEGFDGFKYSDDVQGHNSAYVFEEAKQKVISDGYHESDPTSIKEIDKVKATEVSEKINSEENDFYFDKQLKQEADDFESSPDQDVLKLAQETYEEKIKVLDDLEKQGVITDKGDLGLIKKLKESKIKSDKQLQILEDFKTCLLSGMN
jgi:hypothetical protein